ncbi:MAG: amino acid ABC transporter permease [Clostridiaceae bacterium]|nr:amino acid ABC transporter permease [Clostridiaceae bacterium]
MDFGFLNKYYMLFLIGAKNTILIAFFVVLFGVIIGVILALMKLSKNKLFNILASAYIEFIRGTPILVQLFIVFFGLPKFPGILGDHMEYIAGIIALSINSGAYVAEIIRAGIQAVDKGQMEAARSLGIPRGMAMRFVIIPQAFKNILPALGNEFITVIKESSIVSVIGINELMYNTQTVQSNSFRPFEPLMIVAVMYFILTFTLSKVLGKVERGMRARD